MKETMSASTERTAQHSYPYAALRLACALVCAIVITLDIVSLPAAYSLIQTPCSPCDPNTIQLTVDQMQALKASSLSLQTYSLYMVGLIAFTQFSFIGLGALLFVRRSDDRMALFASLMLITFGGAAFTGTLHALPMVNSLFQTPVYVLNAVGQVAFFTFFYLFPNGRFIPRWTIAPAIVWGLGWLIPLFNDPTLNAYASIITDGWLFVVLVLSIMLAQGYRYWRVSSPRERQQTKWVVYGVGLCLTGFLATIAVGNTLLPASMLNGPVATLLFNTLTYLYFLLIPSSIAVAVLRSRLYDVDALINRTLVYGLLTALLGALYFGLIIGAQTLIRIFTGQQQQSPVVIVFSTLLIAALAQPLRRRLQATIDQRFYRRKYDAARTLQAFGATLRSQVELGDLSASLVDVVEETMRPAQVSLWLRPAAREETSSERLTTR